MLSQHRPFVFPRIEYEKDVQLVWRRPTAPTGPVRAKSRKGVAEEPRSPTGDEARKDMRFYRLNWEVFDEELRRRHGERQRARKIPYAVALPKEYEKMLADMRFAIDEDYMREIRRNAARACEEWMVDRPFDTVIREGCLDPGIAHIKTAFYLLEDCLFDEQASYWVKHETALKMIAQRAMLLKFWTHQTGGGAVWSLSGMRDFEERLERVYPDHEPPYADAMLFIVAVEEHMRRNRKRWEQKFKSFRKSLRSSCPR